MVVLAALLVSDELAPLGISCQIRSVRPRLFCSWPCQTIDRQNPGIALPWGHRISPGLDSALTTEILVLSSSCRAVAFDRQVKPPTTLDRPKSMPVVCSRLFLSILGATRTAQKGLINYRSSLGVARIWQPPHAPRMIPV